MKTLEKKEDRKLLESIEQRLGTRLNYESDSEMHASIIRQGFPSLSRLLKLRSNY